MENLLSRITVDNNVLDGKPCIRGKEFPCKPFWNF